MTDTAQDTEAFTPPYISFAQLQGVLERMRNESIPSRIDRSYLSSWSGSSQAQFLKAVHSLGLLDKHGRPTETLKTLVSQPDERPRLIGDLLREKYPEALALDKSATQQQLDEIFRGYGTSGATTRKAVTFFLHAARFAGIELSPFFTVPRGSAAPRGPATRRRRSNTRSSDNGTGSKSDTPTRDVKQRYIDMLLKRAENEDQLDDKLLDRIERAIGLTEG